VPDSGLSEELEKFITGEIHSLEELEILLLLSLDPRKWWTANMVYDVVKSSPASVEERLKRFARRGMLKTENAAEIHYQFSLQDEKPQRIMSDLRQAYKTHPVKVVQAIYAQPPDPMSEFAKAFRIRKDEM